MTNSRAVTSPEKQCLNAALLLLSRRDHSCRELRIKLRQRGHCKAAVEWAVDRCLHFNYLDDRKYARRRTLMLRKKGYGPYRIRRDLLEKGVLEQLVAAALEDSYETDSQNEDCRTVLAKKLKSARDTSDIPALRKKLYRFLINRGFNQETARHELDLILSED